MKPCSGKRLTCSISCWASKRPPDGKCRTHTWWISTRSSSWPKPTMSSSRHFPGMAWLLLANQVDLAALCAARRKEREGGQQHTSANSATYRSVWCPVLNYTTLRQTQSGTCSIHFFCAICVYLYRVYYTCLHYIITVHNSVFFSLLLSFPYCPTTYTSC